LTVTTCTPASGVCSESGRSGEGQARRDELRTTGRVAVSVLPRRSSSRRSAVVERHRRDQLQVEVANAPRSPATVADDHEHSGVALQRLALARPSRRCSILSRSSASLSCSSSARSADQRYAFLVGLVLLRSPTFSARSAGWQCKIAVGPLPSGVPGVPQPPSERAGSGSAAPPGRRRASP